MYLTRMACTLAAVVILVPHAESLSEESLDGSFCKAIYELACQDYTNAFNTMDGALEQHRPNHRWLWHIRLYKKTFLLRTQPESCHTLSEDGKTWLDTLENRANKSDVDYVKIAVLKSHRLLQYDSTVLNALTNQYPKSEWSDWAKWMLKVNQTRGVMEGADIKVRMMFGLGMGRDALLADVVCESFRRQEIGETSIMRTWCVEVLRRGIGQNRQRMNTYFEMMKELQKNMQEENKVAEYLEKLDAEVTRVWTSKEQHENEMRFILDERPDLDQSELIQKGWVFIDGERQRGCDVPRSIPTTKDEFVRKATEAARRTKTIGTLPNATK